MSVRFTQEDLDVFAIPGFAERMTALRQRVRPKLEALGEELGPVLMKRFKREFFAHTAKHMRRTVNPPDETWVALGPQSRGYKAYIYLAFCIGKTGAQARVVMKDESELRAELGKNLARNKKYFQSHAAQLKRLKDFARRDSAGEPRSIPSLPDFIEESAVRLQSLKSAVFDAGCDVDATSPRLAQEVMKGFDALFPFFECGLRAGAICK